MEVCGLEEGQPIGFRDLLRVDVRDATRAQIGHVQDMALQADLGRVPYIEPWRASLLDRPVGDELVRRAEDLVLLVPWSDVASASEEVIHAQQQAPRVPGEDRGGQMLVRKDILDKQMVDPKAAGSTG